MKRLWHVQLAAFYVVLVGLCLSTTSWIVFASKTSYKNLVCEFCSCGQSTREIQFNRITKWCSKWTTTQNPMTLMYVHLVGSISLGENCGVRWHVLCGSPVLGNIWREIPCEITALSILTDRVIDCPLTRKKAFGTGGIQEKKHLARCVV